MKIVIDVVTKKQGFTLSLEYMFLVKPQGDPPPPKPFKGWGFLSLLTEWKISKKKAEMRSSVIGLSLDYVGCFYRRDF